MSHRCCYLRHSTQASPSGGNLWTLDTDLISQTNTKTNPQPSDFFFFRLVADLSPNLSGPVGSCFL